jgi:hypothetical protein
MWILVAGKSSRTSRMRRDKDDHERRGSQTALR